MLTGSSNVANPKKLLCLRDKTKKGFQQNIKNMGLCLCMSPGSLDHLMEVSTDLLTDNWDQFI